MLTVTRRHALGVALLGAIAATARAQQLRPLEIDEALGTLAINGRMPVDLSPDGTLVAFTIDDARRRESPGDERYKTFTRTGAFSEATGCDIWLADTRTGATRNLTRGKGTSSNPVWSPNGKYLAFYSDRSGTYGLWLWERATGQMKQLSSVIPRPFFGFAGVRWSADSKRIVLKALPGGMTLAQAAELFVAKPKEIAPHEPGSTVVLYAARPASKDSTAPVNSAESEAFVRYLSDVAVVDVPSGTIHRVARRTHAVGYWISPDGSRIVYTDNRGIGAANTQQVAYDIVLAQVADGRSRVLVPKAFMEYSNELSWSPDGSSIAFTSRGQAVKRGEAFVVPLSGGEPRQVTLGEHASLGQTYLAPQWSARGDQLFLLAGGAIWRARLSDGQTTVALKIPNRVITHLIEPGNNVGRVFSPDARTAFVTTRDNATKQTGVYRVDLESGSAERVFEGDQFFSAPLWTADVSDDGKAIIFVAQDAQHGEDLWVAGAGFANPHRLTHVNPHLDQVVLGASRVITWTSQRGDSLRGALLLPAGYREGQRYPLIVKVYAGSMLSDGAFRFGASGGGVENMQLLATRGYAVLLPDVPQRLGTPMSDIAAAVLPGIDKVIELGIADPERLGVTGHSYGGYSTLSLIVQSTRFKAAVSSAGPANLMAGFGAMNPDGVAGMVGWSETGQGLMGGTPWQFRDRYIENSPVTYLDRIQTPLLIVQGGIDRTVPSWQADAVFVGLRRLGKEVTYAKYEGEDHWEGTWSHANAVDYWKRVIQWFDGHLGQRARP